MQSINQSKSIYTIQIHSVTNIKSITSFFTLKKPKLKPRINERLFSFSFSGPLYNGGVLVYLERSGRFANVLNIGARVSKPKKN